MNQVDAGRAVAPNQRRRDIQGLRAIAVLLVVVFHTGVALPGGFSGVDVFFAISGFVITTTLVAELESTGRISLPRFYLRRAKRLLPALALLVIVVADAGMLIGPAAATHLSAMTGIFASFFAANVYLYSLHTGYFAVSTQLDPLLHTWTLAVEEQFYLVFPALLLGAWWIGARRGRGRAAAVLAVAAAGEASFLFATQHGDASGFGIGYYGSPARAWEFAAGALTALGAPLWRRMPRPFALLLTVVGLAGVARTAVSASPTSSLLLMTIVPVAAACALLAAGATLTPASALLTLTPLTRLGDLSYSIYLWHWPLIVFAAALWPDVRAAVPAAAAASLVPAWLSYRYVENPIRHEPRLHGRLAFVMALTCVLVPASIALGATRMPQFGGASYEFTRHVDDLRGCDQWTPYTSRSRVRCTWHTSNARGTVVLIGDSNAGHFTEPFIAAAQRAGYTATVSTPSGCPFIQLRITNTGKDYAGCNHYLAGALPSLLRQRPNLVVISTRTDAFLNRADFILHGSLIENATTPAAKAKLWLPALSSEIAALNRVGVPVVVIEPVPYMPHTEVDCAVIILLAHDCGGSVSRAAVDSDLRETRLINAAATAGKRAWVVSFEDDLCSRSRCSSTLHGVTLYRDPDHLSVSGAETLTGSFLSRVIPHARGWQPEPVALPVTRRTGATANPS